MTKKSDENMQAYLAARSGQKDLVFNGVILADVTRQTSTFNSERAIIYRTAGGNYVAQYVSYHDRKPVDQRAAKCATAADILTFFTVAPTPEQPKASARRKSEASPEPVGKLLDIGKMALEKAGEVDEALRDSHLERVD